MLTNLIRKLLIVVIFSASAAMAEKASIFDLGQPSFQRVDVDSRSMGISQVVQSTSGIMWVASYYGLFTYDGYDYLPVLYHDSEGNLLNDVRFTSVAAASDGVIWAGSKGYGLYRLSEKDRRFIRFDHDPADDESLNTDHIQSVEIDGRGAVWVFTRKGVNYVDPISYKIRRLIMPAEVSGQLEAVTLDQQGGLIVAVSEGIYRLELKGDKLVYKSVISRKNYSVDMIYLDKSGHIWLSSLRDGLKVLRLNGTLDEWPEVDFIQDIIEVDEQEIWVASYSKGVFLFDSRRAILKGRYSADKFRSGAFTSNNLLSLYADSSGLVWMGARGSDLWISTPARNHTRSIVYSPLNSEPKYKHELTGAIETSDGKFWFSTYADGIDVFDPDNGFERTINTSAQSKPILPTNKIRWLNKDREGFIWISTHDAGLLRFRPKGSRDGSGDLLQCQFLKPEEGIIYRSLQTMDGGLLAFMSNPRAVFSIQNETNNCQLKRLEGDAPIESSWVTDVDEKRAILTRNGKNFLLESGSSWAKKLDSVIESDLKGEEADLIGGYRMRSGEIYFSDNHSIFKMKGLSDTDLFLEKIHSNKREVWIFDEDKEGNQWGYGVYRMAGDEEVKSLAAADGELDGLGGSIEFLRSSDGILINMSRYGILLHKTESFEPWSYQPPLVLTDIEVDGVSRNNVYDSLVVPNSKSLFSIAFAALDYTGPSDIRYKYKLQGYSTAWVEVGAGSRIANYVDVPPGEYKFRLRSTNRMGDWSDYELSLAVTIIPAWYQTVWFRVFSFLMFVAGLYSLYLWRLSYYRQKKIELEGLVAERTGDLLETREKLASNEKQAALGRLVSGVAHEINTPLGVVKMASSVVESSALDIFKELSKDNVNEALVNRRFENFSSSNDLLNKNYDRLSNLVSSFKNISIDESQWQFSDFCLVNKISSVKDMFIERLEDQNVAVELAVEKNLHLYSCSSLFNKLLEEFFENALNHAFKGDAIADRKIRIKAFFDNGSSDGEIFVLEFSDNGRGVAEDVAPVIFDPFTAHSTANIGLGLHVLVNLVANVVGGSLNYYKEPAGGARFVFQCPVVRPAAK